MTVVIKTAKLRLDGNVSISIDTTRSVIQNAETFSKLMMRLVTMEIKSMEMVAHQFVKKNMVGLAITFLARQNVLMVL